MAKLSLVKDSTSKLIQVFIQDSSSTTGAGLTGLTSGSSGLTAYYYREGANASASITLTSMTLGTWTSGGFIVVDGTNMPGLYQLGIPDAALATGANSVTVMLKGATNMAPVLLEIELTATNNQDAVRGGMTALPNAAAAANGGLPTVDANNAVKLQSGTGANQISLSSGAVIIQSGTGTGQLSLSSGAVIVQSGTSAGQIDLSSGQVKVQSGTGAGQILTSSGKVSIVSTDIDAVWDVTLASHVSAGSTGFALNAAGSAGDPWATALPGAYSAGTAGFILGTNLNATISGVPTANWTLSNGIETGWTPQQAMRIMLSALGGKLSGAATTTVVIRNVTDAKDRVTATVDANGNRTAVTYDAT